MPTVKEMIEKLKRNYKEDDVICAPIWGAEDVMEKVKEMYEDEYNLEDYDHLINETFYNDVLEDMERGHDCSIGITWDSMEVCISMKMEALENEQFEKTHKKDLPLFVNYNFMFSSSRKIFEKRMTDL